MIVSPGANWCGSMTASRAAISVSFRLLNSGMPLSVAIASPSDPAAGPPAAAVVVVASAGGVEASLILLPSSDECGCGTGDTDHTPDGWHGRPRLGKARRPRRIGW